MPQETFISLRSAAELAGTDKKAIERAYKKHLESNNLTMDSAQHIIRRKAGVKRKEYEISESFVHDVIISKLNSGNKKKTQGTIEPELVQQLRVKDTQIETHARHIDELTERLKDAQKSLQAEQSLHLTTQHSKKPLLRLFGARENATQVVTEIKRGVQPIHSGRVVAAAAVCFSFVTVGIIFWLTSL